MILVQICPVQAEHQRFDPGPVDGDQDFGFALRSFRHNIESIAQSWGNVKEGL